MILLLQACSGREGEPTPPPLPVAAEKATFTTVTGLGPHHMHAEVARTMGGGAEPPQTTAETLDLRWRDTDHWAFSLARDGRVRNEMVIWDGIAWSGAGDALKRQGDAEPFRVQLAQTWDPWAYALESLADQLTLTETESALVEGRRAQGYRIAAPESAVAAAEPADPASTADPPKKRKAERPKRGWTVNAADGEVWIDESTAVRLKGDVHLTAIAGERTREVRLTFALDGLGVEPEIPVPGRDKQ